MSASPSRAAGSDVVVLIDGRSGAGKTSLAGALAARTGAALVHVEDYYPGWNGLAAGAEAIVSEVLEPWLRGESVALRRWNWHEDRFEPAGALAAGGNLIIEGCGAISRRSRPLADLAIWLEGEESLRRTRARARDGDDAWWSPWREQEDAFYAVEGSPTLADLILGPTTGVDELLAMLSERGFAF